MRIIKDYKACPQSAKGSVVALGNFDGVHKGHVAVIKKALEIAKQSGSQSSVLTFEPHPINVLKASAKPFRITTEQQKNTIIETLGIDNLFIINFSHSFSEMKAENFIREVLVESLGTTHIVTGEDFIFGHNRDGNSILLDAASEKYGFGYSRVVPVGNSDEKFSSTLIRKCLASGNLEQARKILGRNFVISGIVEHGNQQGRSLGFPTINIDLGEYIRPAFGVYAAILHIQGRNDKLYSAANIGIKPTVGGTKELLEVHIFDFSENIYGHNVEIELIEYIRPEQKFGSIEELSQQIAKDCNNIRKILK